MGDTLVQIAIDTTSIALARPLVQASIRGGADWIEIGKPLIEFEGLRGVRELVAEIHDQYVLLDLMIISGSEKYIRAALDLGASNVTVSALAPKETVAEAIAIGKRTGVDITIDLFNTPNLVETARTFAAMGADYLMVHFGVDQKRRQPKGSPIHLLRSVVDAVNVPISYATYDIDESRAAVEAGASIIVQGEPLLTQPDPASGIRDFVSKTKSPKAGA